MPLSNKILIPDNGLIHLINQDNIVYFKADNCYTHVYLTSSQCYLLVKSLKKVSEELAISEFIRVNQSYLVNKRYIEIINKKEKIITMVNDIKIPFTIRVKDLLTLITDNGIK